MKKIEAVIPPFKLGDVKEEFEKIDFQDFTVVELKDFLSDARHREIHRGVEIIMDFRFAIKIEIVCVATSATAVRDAVVKAAYGGRSHNGILTVSDIEKVLDL